MSGENPPIKGYRRVVTDDGRVIYVPARSEDMLVAARAVASIRKGKQYPVVFDGAVSADGAIVFMDEDGIKIVSNDMNVEYLPDRETFVLRAHPVPVASYVNPSLPVRKWRRPRKCRR